MSDQRQQQPVYAPNSYGGPKADPQRYSDPSWFVESAENMRTAHVLHKDDNDFPPSKRKVRAQPRTWVSSEKLTQHMPFASVQIYRETTATVLSHQGTSEDLI